ncbi:MAG: redoxin family protein, partial [Patescibacteria group bacterium]
KFKLADFVGKKVILVDFWTYSCINCQRTTPYLNMWYEKYKDKGFAIVGVHTPEFEFEKNYDNVARAVKEAGIIYPVVLDSNFGTWNAYNNRYWPHKYLIDIDGYIVYDHIGEGKYDATEQAIQDALKERRAVLHVNDAIDTNIASPPAIIPTNSSLVKSPEIYFGSARNQSLGNGIKGVTGIQTLSLPLKIDGNILYLDGKWNFESEFAQTVIGSGRIVFTYNAKNVYMVASSPSGGAGINVTRDGKPLGSEIGKDIGLGLIKDERLYELIRGSDYGQHTIEIDIKGDLRVFTFTFG